MPLPVCSMPACRRRGPGDGDVPCDARGRRSRTSHPVAEPRSTRRRCATQPSEVANVSGLLCQHVHSTNRSWAFVWLRYRVVEHLRLGPDPPAGGQADCGRTLPPV